MDMLNVYDLNRRKTAVLQNAYQITETKELNKIYSLTFSLPATDEKAQYLQPYHYVRYGEGSELYRIIGISKTESDTGTLNVSCEHVIATLVDDVMFGNEKYGGGSITTPEVIRHLLMNQHTKNWTLSQCDFSRKFEYLWEQENILNALYSIPKEFSKSYQWVFDTVSYPWKVSLKLIDESIHPEYYIRAESNLLSSQSGQDYTSICTRIYPLGYGEGVNQLTIKEAKVNRNTGEVDEDNGVKYGNIYIQAPDAIISKYGLKEKVLVDRRYENANSLYQYAKTMLDALSVPTMSRSFSVVDLYPLTGAEIDNAQPGQICELTIDGTKACITKTVRVLDDPGNLQITLSTKATDIAANVADLADRVRIESVYAQGATQIYQHSKDANATSDKGMVLSLYFPEEMKQINKVLLTLKLERFRSYSQATEYAGASTQTSSKTEETSYTSLFQATSEKTTKLAQSTVGTTKQNEVETTSTENGGGTGKTSTNDSSVSVSGTTATNWEDADYTLHFATMSGDADGLQGVHSHGVEAWPVIPREAFNHSHELNISSTGSHSHEFEIESHKHTITIPSHSHEVTIPEHSHKYTAPQHKHEVKIPGHSHTVDIPKHNHSITAGIFESGSPKKFDIYVGGKKKATVNSTSYNGDITSWLLNDKNMVDRDTWIEVKIVPDDLAYVVSSVFVQGFVQSRGGGNY